MNKPFLAVWIDHHEARVFRVSASATEEVVVHAPEHRFHRHARGPEAHDHPDDGIKFFDAIANAIGPAESVLLVGPSTAKLHFLRYLGAHHQPLERKIVAVETVDHPTDAQLVAHAKRYFEIAIPRIGVPA